MNAPDKQFDDLVWSKLFDFIYPQEETLNRHEVQEELKRQRIDIQPSFAKLRQILLTAQEQQKARASLECAKQKRPGIMIKLKQISTSISAHVENIDSAKGDIQGIISQLFTGSEQTAYFRKLEKSSSEEDLKSLLEDMDRLSMLKENSEDDVS